MYKPILYSMLEYNKEIKRFIKAEIYFADDSIPISEKILQADNTQTLVNHLAGLADKINGMGYAMSREEYTDGFRQIEFLMKNGGIV